MPFLRRKVKATKEEFAEALFYWFALHLNTERVQETAKLFQFDIGSKKNLEKLVSELFDLNMWLVVHTCQRVFADIDKRNACLDIFHSLVYQRLQEGIEIDFNEWLIRLSSKYADYYKAREKEHKLGPLWELATEFNINLHGKLNLDAFVQYKIAKYIGSVIEALEGLVKQYKISNG